MGEVSEEKVFRSVPIRLLMQELKGVNTSVVFWRLCGAGNTRRMVKLAGGKRKTENKVIIK